MELQNSKEVLHDFSPRFLIYKDGSIKRLREDIIVPASYDSKSRVHSRDVKVSEGASARIYRPDDIPENAKLPVVIYYHGGAYSQFSAFSQMYHTHLNLLVSEANVIAVSVDYRLAPEYPMPACYDDTWDVTEWVLSHSGGEGSDPWITQWGDLGRIFLIGDSAGGNFSHNMMAQASRAGLLGSTARVEGVMLVHPFFADGRQKLMSILRFLSNETMDELDPRLNPMADLAQMRKDVVCDRMLVCVDKDCEIKENGILYYEALKASGWEGRVELLETNGGGHVFHLWDHTLEKSREFLKVITSFINKAT